jgi:hypothetical protein
MSFLNRIATLCLVCAAVVSAQTGQYLQVSLEGLSGEKDLVSGGYPNTAGMGKDIKPAIDVSNATSLSVKLRAVADTPIPAEQTLQARIYVKTDTVEYIWATPEGATAFTDLTLDTWVELDVPLAEFMQSSGTPKWTELTQVGVQLSTYGGLVFSGQIHIDDFVAKTAADPVVISDFEDITHGWKEQDVGGTLGAVITGISIPGASAVVAGGGGMKLTVEGLDGSEVGGTWPNQTAVGKVTIPTDISTAENIGVLIYPDAEIPAGSALQARIYIKTGEDWTWSTTESFTDLVGRQWNKVVVKTSDLVQVSGEAMADPTQMREIGIQFFTWNMTFTGTIYVDNFFTDQETLFDFEDITGWSEVDVGQTLDVVLTSVEQVADVASLTGVGILHPRAAATLSGGQMLVSTAGRSMTVRYAVSGAGRVSAGLYSLDGSLVAQLFDTPAAGAGAAAWTGQLPVSSGTWCIRVVGPGLNSAQTLQTVR